MTENRKVTWHLPCLPTKEYWLAWIQLHVWHRSLVLGGTFSLWYLAPHSSSFSHVLCDSGFVPVMRQKSWGIMSLAWFIFVIILNHKVSPCLLSCNVCACEFWVLTPAKPALGHRFQVYVPGCVPWPCTFVVVHTWSVLPCWFWSFKLKSISIDYDWKLSCHP